MSETGKPIEMWDRGFWISLGGRGYRGLYIHSPWWHVVLKPCGLTLFSERYGYAWSRVFGHLRLTVRRRNTAA